MNASSSVVHEFRLSPPGSGQGISCDAQGAFVGGIPLLKRSHGDVRDHWEPRDCSHLSKQIGADFGLPIDMSSKVGGLNAICNALNDDDIARAQIATVLLGIPDPPRLIKGAGSRSDTIKFIRTLEWSGLIKADWDPDEHPRWPAGTASSQGGQFAPKGQGGAEEPSRSQSRSSAGPARNRNSLIPVAANARDDISRNPPGRKSEEECDRQYDADMYVCNSLRDKREAAICRASASERYSACLSGRPLPPLTLPDPESDFAPAPAPSRHFPSSPPPWLPLLFVPFFFGLPA